jgi:hypothetical protein
MQSKDNITLFKAIAMLCGIFLTFNLNARNILHTTMTLQNIPHIQVECEEYSIYHYKSHKPLLYMGLNNVMKFWSYKKWPSHLNWGLGLLTHLGPAIIIQALI